jgi:glucokinase
VILAGDVGGTKTRLALYDTGGNPRAPLREQRYVSADFATLEALVLDFAASDRGAITAAAFGIAGPVVDNRCIATNLPWRMEGRTLGEALGGARVQLLNDLSATGLGIPRLEGREIETLQAGNPSPGARALIAAGTGLGEGILLWDGRRHWPGPSEGGHVDFGPRDEFEDGLNVFLRKLYGRTSYERILSGKGMADLVRFLRERGEGDEPAAFTAAFDADPDPAHLVTTAALDGTCGRAAIALERWLRIYGSEAGNLALTTMAVNGLFVGGGIAPRVASAIRAGGFMESFRDKGRLRPVLERIPVHMILDDRAALWGAASFAFALHAGEDRD